MRFENPMKKNYEKKINNAIDNSKENLMEENEVTLPLSEIIKEDIKEKASIEFIEYPHNAKITGIPRNMDLPFNKSWSLSIIYESNLDSAAKIM